MTRSELSHELFIPSLKIATAELYEAQIQALNPRATDKSV